MITNFLKKLNQVDDAIGEFRQEIISKFGYDNLVQQCQAKRRSNDRLQ